ncbi:hypothetical protein C8035_v007209 [Colletotrichum spinosum]|uniref:Uncharacterized protein n=1 Tax=Colletotrichum spinosum TaxID=1347390 RepID=A0A4R8QHF4_9PEZI|nr:hypothetical protein C8035_v007209 [Colletotrichum spinosum]
MTTESVHQDVTRRGYETTTSCPHGRARSQVHRSGDVHSSPKTRTAIGGSALNGAPAPMWRQAMDQLVRWWCRWILAGARFEQTRQRRRRRSCKGASRESETETTRRLLRAVGVRRTRGRRGMERSRAEFGRPFKDSRTQGLKGPLAPVHSLNVGMDRAGRATWASRFPDRCGNEAVAPLSSGPLVGGCRDTQDQMEQSASGGRKLLVRRWIPGLTLASLPICTQYGHTIHTADGGVGSKSQALMPGRAVITAHLSEGSGSKAWFWFCSPSQSIPVHVHMLSRVTCVHGHGVATTSKGGRAGTGEAAGICDALQIPWQIGSHHWQ